MTSVGRPVIRMTRFQSGPRVPLYQCAQLTSLYFLFGKYLSSHFCTFRSALQMKKDSYQRKLQNYLQVQMLGRKNWYGRNSIIDSAFLVLVLILKIVQFMFLVLFFPILQVTTAVNGLRESATSRTNRFQKEMSTMKESNSSVRVEWTNYSKKAETHYLEDTAAVENGKKNLDEVLQNWQGPPLSGLTIVISSN